MLYILPMGKEKLNNDSPLPLYRQLADIIYTKIERGEYRRGEKIPSENELAALFALGRPTVRQATDLLIRQKQLSRKRGSGTYVCQPSAEIDLFSLAGTSSAFQKQGISLTVAIVEAIGRKKNPTVEESADCYYFSRLSLVAGSPILLEEIYLHPLVFRGIESIDLNKASLARVIREKYYLTPTGGKQVFNIITVDPKRADLLQITGKTPILKVERWLNFKQGENLIYADIYCKTDKFKFSQIIGGNYS